MSRLFKLLPVILPPVHWQRIVILVMCILASSTRAEFQQRDGRIIEWGWNTPTPAQLQANSESMQQLPFGGLGLDLRHNAPPGNGVLSSFVWGTQTLNSGDYSNSIQALQNTAWSSFSDIYLRFNVSPGRLDWFDDYNAVMANAQLVANVTQQPSLRGILFDVEPYTGFVWNYQNQPQKSQHTFQQYETQARQRGMEFMNALQTGNPGVQVLLTYGYEIAPGGVLGPSTTARESHHYGLLPSFLDGMVAAAGPDNIIYDGWERAYGNRSSGEFEWAYEQMRQMGLSASFGLWLDNGGQWNNQDFSVNYFKPHEFQFSLQEALKRTEGYVWVYSQVANWWDGTMPDEYVQALQNVRTYGLLERFEGTTKDTATWTAYVLPGSAVTQSGRLVLYARQAHQRHGQADYTSNTITVGVGDIVAVEVINHTKISGSSALLGLALTNDSGGTINSTPSDNRLLEIFWSDNDNTIYAGVNDAIGTNQLTAIYSGDHPTSTTYIYQIERLSLTSARFSIINEANGASIGSPVTLFFQDMPGDLLISAFAQSAKATFDNVWIGRRRRIAG